MFCRNIKCSGNVLNKELAGIGLASKKLLYWFTLCIRKKCYCDMSYFIKDCLSSPCSSRQQVESEFPPDKGQFKLLCVWLYRWEAVRKQQGLLVKSSVLQAVDRNQKLTFPCAVIDTRVIKMFLHVQVLAGM